MAFYSPNDNVAGLQLAQPYAAGATAITLGAGQGARFVHLPTLITIVPQGTWRTAADASTRWPVYGIPAGGIVGDVATVSLVSGADRNFAAGDRVDCRPCEKYVADLNAAVTALQGGGGGGGGYAAPAFTAFAISGQATTLEVGASIASGSHTFAWTASNPSNVAANSISIVDTTNAVTLASGLANTGSAAITFGSSIASNAPAAHTWTTSGADTQSDTFSRTFSVNWQWRAFWGTSANPELTALQVQALANSALASGIAGTYTLAPTGFMYVAVPTSFPAPASFVEPSTGFNVPMAQAADDSHFTGTDSNGNNFLPATLTNTNGVSRAYAVYRTQYSQSIALTMRVA